MELWIRTQDRTTLIRSYEIYIAEHSKSYVIRAKRTSHILGAYKTIERALEVLDSIQSCIQTNTAFDLYAKLGSFADDFNNKYNLVPVYQMPEE